MHTFLFINPASGRFAQHRVAKTVRLLQQNGLRPEVRSITTPADALPHCEEINALAQPPLVIVAAGDGTMNTVVNGLQPGQATLAILPLGTSNVLAAELGIVSLEDGIRRIKAGITREMSVGVVETAVERRRFVLMAGIGVDGTVVRDVWPLGKRLLRQGAYAAAALFGSLTWDRSLIGVITAGCSFQCHSTIICNASRYGGNFVLSPESSLYSPELTAVCIRNNQRRTYLRLALELLAGRTDTSRELIRIPANGIEIRGIKPIQIDGDFLGYSPAKIYSMANFARIIV